MFAQVIAGLLALGACEKSSAKMPSLTFLGDPTVAVRLEIASTPQSRTQGLMYRRTLAADTGMLFIFPDEAPRSFWMKNTYLALDMIFIDSRPQVVGVVENAEPLTLQARGVPQAARYVLEVNAGFARTHGVHVGQKVQVDSLPQATE